MEARHKRPPAEEDNVSRVVDGYTYFKQNIIKHIKWTNKKRQEKLIHFPNVSLYLLTYIEVPPLSIWDQRTVPTKSNTAECRSAF